MAVGFLVWDPNFVRDADGTKVGRWIECHADSVGRLVLSPGTTVSLSTNTILPVTNALDLREAYINNNLLNGILTQLKVIVAQNNEVHDLNITELDVKEK